MTNKVTRLGNAKNLRTGEKLRSEIIAFENTKQNNLKQWPLWSTEQYMIQDQMPQIWKPRKRTQMLSVVVISPHG